MWLPAALSGWINADSRDDVPSPRADAPNVKAWLWEPRHFARATARLWPFARGGRRNMHCKQNVRQSEVLVSEGIF